MKKMINKIKNFIDYLFNINVKPNVLKVRVLYEWGNSSATDGSRIKTYFFDINTSKEDLNRIFNDHENYFESTLLGIHEIFSNMPKEKLDNIKDF